MFLATFYKTMSRSAAGSASRRTAAVARHMSSSSSSEPTVLFESKGSLRTFILNRPSKLNALDDTMLSLLRPKIEARCPSLSPPGHEANVGKQEWSKSDLCGVIVARGVGRAFCIGGDVANVAANVQDDATRATAIEYFKKEFEMDYILAALQKPYVAVLDGMTMGGGVGLAANAPFRVATEKTVFAMPETKIGYCPDVGGSYFLSRLDGEIGTYLALTSESLSGRAVYEHGFATHYISSSRVPALLERLAELEKPQLGVINKTIEEFSWERDPAEKPAPFTGAVRLALDASFRHNEVERIFTHLESFAKNTSDRSVREWATKTLAALELRSPTSLKVALRAVRHGKNLNLLEALNMELKIATAFCNGASPDFVTGVNAVLVEKIRERPNWTPSTVKEVSKAVVDGFFDPTSPYLSSAPELSLPPDVKSGTIVNPLKFTLPTEEEIGQVVMGSHSSAGGMGIRVPELLARFEELRGRKNGLKEKLEEVIHRRCELTDNADGNRVWLKWKQ